MDDYFRKLKANDVKIVDGNSVVRDLVARGDVSVGLTDTDDVNVAIEAKQPVAMVLPDRDGMGVPVMPNMVSLVAGAPHPDEGKRLIDYLLSAEVERKLAESEAVQIPLHAGVPGPKNIPPIDSFKPMTLDYAKAASRVEDVTSVSPRSSVCSRVSNTHVGMAVQLGRSWWHWRSPRSSCSASCRSRIMLADVVHEPGGRRRPIRDLLLDRGSGACCSTRRVLGVGTALAATLVGVPLGFALRGSALPFKAALRILLAAPASCRRTSSHWPGYLVSKPTWMRSLPAARSSS